MTYFDAVLNKNMMPLFNGTPDETREWLQQNTTDKSDMVCEGVTLRLMTIPEYLEKGQGLTSDNVVDKT